MDESNEDDRCSVTSSSAGLQTQQEPPYQRPPSKNQPPSRNSKPGLSREQESRRPPLPADPESPPSPLDGSPLISTAYLSESAPPPQPSELTKCHCRHGRHCGCEYSVPQSPGGVSAAAEERGWECCHTCLQPCPRATDDASRCQQHDTKPKARKNAKAYGLGTFNDVARECSKITSKHRPQFVAKEHIKEISTLPSQVRRASTKLCQILLVTMGFIIFVFAFAILVSHCLAWFLVYKTEARLGDMRTGLLRGGEMKLCLCGRG